MPEITPVHNDYIAVAYGTLAEYEELVSRGVDLNEVNTIYFLTDVNKIILNRESYSGDKSLFDYKGHVNSVNDLPTSATNTRVSHTDIYTVGDAYRLYTYDFDTNKWIELSKIPRGSITFDQLGGFVDGVELSDSGNKIPTSQVIKKYIEDNIINLKGVANGFATLDSEGHVLLSQLKFDNALKDTSENAVQNKVVKSALDHKVEVDGSKKLSTHDFTDEFRNKVLGLEVASTTPVQSDWNETNPDSRSYIKNKPYIDPYLKPDKSLAVDKDLNNVSDEHLISSKAVKDIIDKLPSVEADSQLSLESDNPVQNKVVTKELEKKVTAVEGKGLSSNDFTNEYKEQIDSLKDTSFTQEDRVKLDSISYGAQVNVQPDWSAGTDEFTGDGSTTEFVLFNRPVDKVFDVTINSISTEEYSYNEENNSIVFNSAPPVESTIVINYVSTATILNKPSFSSFVNLDDGIVGT